MVDQPSRSWSRAALGRVAQLILCALACSAVPAGAAAEPPGGLLSTSWFDYWWYVVGGIVAAESLLIVGLLLERRRRQRAEESLAERLSFERLLSEESATFSSLSESDEDQAIRQGLRRIADFFAADWGCLAEFSDDRLTACITHSWTAQGAPATPSTIPLAEIPWVISRLQQGLMTRFSRLDELPAEAAAVDRRTFARLGIASHVELPLKGGHQLLGALMFSSLRGERVWPDELVQRLQLLGEMFGRILARRRSAMVVQQLRRDLTHVGRVSTVGELTVSLAHELNQPLTAILNNAQTAQELLSVVPTNVAEMQEILADIVDDDRRAVEVIRRLRGLVKKDGVEPADLDINEVVEEVARLIAGDALLRSVQVRLELTAHLPRVHADRVQVQQVILNLILNSLDAMRESAIADRRLLLRTAPSDHSGVEVAVEDTGMGFDDRDVELLFQPFHTTRPDGMGMGLTISRSVVEAHGGRLIARNNPGGGATFSFTLPTSGPA